MRSHRRHQDHGRDDDRSKKLFAGFCYRMRRTPRGRSRSSRRRLAQEMRTHTTSATLQMRGNPTSSIAIIQARNAGRRRYKALSRRPKSHPPPIGFRPRRENRARVRVFDKSDTLLNLSRLRAGCSRCVIIQIVGGLEIVRRVVRSTAAGNDEQDSKNAVSTFTNTIPEHIATCLALRLPQG